MAIYILTELKVIPESCSKCKFYCIDKPYQHSGFCRADYFRSCESIKVSLERLPNCPLYRIKLEKKDDKN